MKVLVVGGTADGRYLASELHALGIDVIYSIAGIARKATLPCAVVTGGFTQFGGLQAFIVDNHITHLVDATHPFAQTISNKVAQVSNALLLPAIRFHRPAWQKTAQDNWIEVTQWPELIEKVAQHQSLFITAGQVTQTVIDQLAAQAKHLLLRTAMPTQITLPKNVTWIKAIGPFELAHEQQLMAQYQIDAVISKNSGGDATYAKIKAAAKAGIPVYQFKRPDLLATAYQCDDQQSCITLLFALGEQINETPLTDLNDKPT